MNPWLLVPLVVLGIVGWTLIVAIAYFVVAGVVWPLLVAAYPDDAVVLLLVATVLLCFLDAPKVNGKRQWVIPK